MAAWVVGLFTSGVVGLVVLGVGGFEAGEDLPLGWVAVVQAGLWFGWLGVPWWAARTRGNGFVSDFGLRVRPVDVPAGLAIGVACQLLLLPLVYLPIFELTETDADELGEVARDLTERATQPWEAVLLVLIVGVGAPVVEEILYRGMAQRALRRWAGSVVAVGVSSLWFAAAHFQVLQFAGLFAFALVLGYLEHRTRRLGTAIFAHVGFNLTTVLILLS